MIRSIKLFTSAFAIRTALSLPAFAQGAPQTITPTEVNETVGKIDDLIVTPTDKVPFAILSVGSYLRMDK